MSAPFRIELLGAQHTRSEVSSGTPELDRYFRTQVTQDVRRRVTTCYVVVEQATATVAGYYTLAAASIVLADLPQEMARRLPRYPSVPAARLGRLAVDRRFRGQGLGGALLWDAIERARRSELAVYALVVDAKDDAAAAFYQHHGFVRFGSLPRQWFLPFARLVSPP